MIRAVAKSHIFMQQQIRILCTSTHVLQLIGCFESVAVTTQNELNPHRSVILRNQCLDTFIRFYE